MSNAEVYAAGWSLDDVDWSRFDASKVDPELLGAVKAASLVEYNAHDYVAYLKRVYRGAPAETMATIERWGEEEVQHGLALGRWAEMADPNFDFHEILHALPRRLPPAAFHLGRRQHPRQPPRRNDRPLRGGKRHIVVLFGDPRRGRRAGR